MPRVDGGGNTDRDAGTSDAGGTVTRDAGSAGSQCLAGIQPCGLAGQAPCPQNAYCITGCCVVAPQ